MKKYFMWGKATLIVGLLITSNACTNLDEQLYDQVEESNFLRNEAEVKAAVGAAYVRLYGLMNHGNYFSTQEVNSNEVLIPQRGNDWFDGGQWIKTHRHTQDGGEDCYNNSWNFLYSGVNTCNRLILQVSQAVEKGNLAEATGDAYVAELRGLRALFYYWLLDSFGNVPIVDRFDVPEDFKPATNTRAQVYAFVETELKDIITGGKLVQDVSASTYGRFTVFAAHALRAKLKLNAGVYTGTPDWAGCIESANAVINSGKFRPAANYRDNFVTQNQSSPEMIFAIPYDQVFAQGFNIGQMTLHYESQKSFNLQAQPWNGYCAATDFYNSYETGDSRKTNNFVVGPQFAADATTRLQDNSAEDGTNGASLDPDGKPLTFTPEINMLEPKCLRQAGARIGKFEFANGATPNLSNDFPILRYADIWLVKAEAEARQAGNWDLVLPYTEPLRARAGLANLSGADIEGQFLAERGREFFYEGWRRQDLVRFGKFNEKRGLRETDSDPKRALWPIPKPQIASNPNLAQNDGY
jgi:starch-binding outer membrane protein, SusD/RagB family